MDKGRITAIHNVIYGSDYMEEVREQLHAALDELVQERADLLAALEELAHPTMDAHDLAHLDDFHQGDIETARDAIAKAKGES